MLGVSWEGHAGVDHGADRRQDGLEGGVVTDQLGQDEELVEHAQLVPPKVLGATPRAHLDPLDDGAVLGVRLRVQVVAERQLADDVDAEPLAPLRHVNCLAPPAGPKQLAQERVDLPHHLGLEDAHRPVRKNRGYDGPLFAVQLPIQSRQDVGRPFVVQMQVSLALGDAWAGVNVVQRLRRVEHQPIRRDSDNGAVLLVPLLGDEEEVASEEGTGIFSERVQEETVAYGE